MAVYLCVDQDGWTGGIQLSIDDESGGYRISGPKFNGSSKRLKRHRLTERDCSELERYIAKARALSPSTEGEKT